jgi:hypothetical protein
MSNFTEIIEKLKKEEKLSISEILKDINLPSIIKDKKIIQKIKQILSKG